MGKEESTMKTDDETEYMNVFMREFNKYLRMLRPMFRDNPNHKKFKYYGVVERRRGHQGILVSGIDPKGIRKFENFYSLYDIQDFHYNNNKKKYSKIW